MTEEHPVETTAEEGQDREEAAVEIGTLLFQWRDYTPIPLIILLLIASKPTAISATLGLLSVTAGELIRIYSVAFIGSISRTRSGNTGAQLINTGPFAYVRNPLYVGNFLIAMGIAIFGGKAWVAALTAALFAFQYYYIVRYEESVLIVKFGDAYRQYLREVPAWIPRRKILVDQIEWPASFSKALKSEKRTFMAIVAIIVVLLFISAS